MNYLERLSDPDGSASSEINTGDIDPAVLSIQECFQDLLTLFNILASASPEHNLGVLAIELTEASMDTGTEVLQYQAEIKRKQISTRNLKTLAQFLTHSQVQLQHLSDTNLPSHMIKSANKLFGVAMKWKRRPATDGIDLEVFLCVIAHSMKRGKVKLPLISVDDLPPSTVKQLDVFWKDQQLDKMYAELDLQTSAKSACEDSRNAWRNLRAGARIVVSGPIDCELAAELNQLSSSDSDADKNDDAGPATDAARKEEGPRSAPGQMPAGQQGRPKRRKMSYQPAGIPNTGNSCYKNVIVQV